MNEREREHLCHVCPNCGHLDVWAGAVEKAFDQGLGFNWASDKEGIPALRKQMQELHAVLDAAIAAVAAKTREVTGQGGGA